MLLKPREVTVTDRDGIAKTFVISRVPAVAMRQIVATYPASALPKIGEYKTNEEMMLMLMGYVGVPQEGGREPLALQTRALIDSHVADFEALLKLEAAMFEYNTSFFDQGKISGFLKVIAPRMNTLISSTLTALLGQLLQAAKQHSKNSETTTT